jgi:hypothetical protein
MDSLVLSLFIGIIIGLVIGGVTGYMIGGAQERFEEDERQLKKAIDESKQDLLKAQIKHYILEEIKAEKP